MLSTDRLPIGITLRKAHKAAIADRNLQTEAHRGFTAGLPPALVKEWEGQCIDWEKAKFPKSTTAKVNPYAVEENCEYDNLLLG